VISRLSKRGLISLTVVAFVAGIAFVAGRGGASSNKHLAPESVTVTAFSIPYFKHDAPTDIQFGQLEYLGGLELRGAHANFGGISAIRVDGDGERFLSVTDTGDWITGRISYKDKKPSSLNEVVISPTLGGDGKRNKDNGLWDSESIARDGDHVFIGIEREHTVLAYDFARGGIRAVGKQVPLPAYVKKWPDNRGIEALGIMPSASPYAGHLIGLSERSGGREDATEGFVMKRDGSEPFRFSIHRSDGFDVTDLDFLPSGDLIVLERYFSPIRGVAMRLRRFKTAAIQPEAILSGETLLTADGRFHVDNMEGLSIHRNREGDTVFTIISDDNFSVAQRTLLLQFKWLGN
jgi:hypothetical protein